MRFVHAASAWAVAKFAYQGHKPPALSNTGYVKRSENTAYGLEKKV
jgi:hypothetical protein